MTRTRPEPSFSIVLLSALLLRVVCGCTDVHRQPPELIRASPFPASLPIDSAIGVCDLVGLSADARYVAYRASPELEGATEGRCLMYVFDRQTRTVHPVHAAGELPGDLAFADVRPILETLSFDGQTLYQVLLDRTDPSGPQTLRAHRWAEGTETLTNLEIRVDLAGVSGDDTVLFVVGWPVGARDAETRVYDLASGMYTMVPALTAGRVVDRTNVVVSRTGEWAAGAGAVFEDGTSRRVRWIADLRTGVVQDVASPEVLPWTDLAFVGDDRLMMTSPEGIRVVRDLRTGVTTPHPLADIDTDVRPSTDGATALVDNAEIRRGDRPVNSLREMVWRGEEGLVWLPYSASSALFGLDHETTVYVPDWITEAISPDGQWVVFMGHGRTDAGEISQTEYFLVPTRW